jgi:hypothetical protein
VRLAIVFVAGLLFCLGLQGAARTVKPAAQQVQQPSLCYANCNRTYTF